MCKEDTASFTKITSDLQSYSLPVESLKKGSQLAVFCLVIFKLCPSYSDRMSNWLLGLLQVPLKY